MNHDNLVSDILEGVDADTLFEKYGNYAFDYIAYLCILLGNFNIIDNFVENRMISAKRIFEHAVNANGDIDFIIKKYDPPKLSMLRCVIETNKFPILQLLLRKIRFSQTELDKALEHAAFFGRNDFIVALLDAGAKNIARAYEIAKINGLPSADFIEEYTGYTSVTHIPTVEELIEYPEPCCSINQ